MDLGWWIQRYREEIADAQSQTRYFHMLELHDPQEPVKWSELSSKVSGVATNITTNDLCWRDLQEHIKFILQEMRASGQFTGVTKSSKVDPSDRVILGLLTQLRKEAASMLRDTNALNRKAMIQIQGLFNLIVRQDQMFSLRIARDSRKLAEESKKDSNSMKCIAAVTMVFFRGHL